MDGASGFTASRGSRTKASSSYSTLIAFSASYAWARVSAATAATSSPSYRARSSKSFEYHFPRPRNHGMSAPGVFPVITARTPGIFSAALVSTDFTTACACGQRRIAAWSMSGRAKSSG